MKHFHTKATVHIEQSERVKSYLGTTSGAKGRQKQKENEASRKKFISGPQTHTERTTPEPIHQSRPYWTANPTWDPERRKIKEKKKTNDQKPSTTQPNTRTHERGASWRTSARRDHTTRTLIRQKTKSKKEKMKEERI